MFDKLITPPLDGGLPFFNADFVNIEAYGADLFKTYLDKLIDRGSAGSLNYDSVTYLDTSLNTVNFGIILEGCGTGNITGTTFDIAEGYIYVDNEICYFAGATGVTRTNRNYLVRAQTSTKVQKTTQAASLVDFTETWTAVLTSDTAGGNNPVPWATQYCEFQNLPSIGAVVESPSWLDGVLARATAVIGTAIASDVDTAFSNRARMHGFTLVSGGSAPSTLSNGFSWWKRQ